MKRLFLVACLTMIGLSGCYVVPQRVHGDVYRGDRDYRDGGGYQQNDAHHDVGRQDDHRSRDERDHKKDQKERKGRNDSQDHDHDYGGDDHDGYH